MLEEAYDEMHGKNKGSKIGWRRESEMIPPVLPSIEDVQPVLDKLAKNSAMTRAAQT